jgi:hypothetical protein
MGAARTFLGFLRSPHVSVTADEALRLGVGSLLGVSAGEATALRDLSIDRQALRHLEQEGGRPHSTCQLMARLGTPAIGRGVRL